MRAHACVCVCVCVTVYVCTRKNIVLKSVQIPLLQHTYMHGAMKITKFIGIFAGMAKRAKKLIVDPLTPKQSGIGL